MSDEDIYVFRKADSGDEDCLRFCSLLNSLSGKKQDSDYYRWQYFRTPFPAVLSFAFNLEGNFAGCFGFHILPTNCGISIARAVDIMIAPEFQGKGLFRKLAAYAESCAAEYSPAAVVVIADKKSEPSYTYGLGWSLTATLRTYTAPAIEYPGHDMQGCIVPITDWSIVQDIAAARCSIKKPLVSISGDTDYLKWRYTECPWHTYEAFAYIQNDLPRGYVVTKRYTDPEDNTSYGDIVDITWDERNDDPARELLRYTLHRFQDIGVDRAAMWLHTNTDLDMLGSGAGFVPVSHERYFCCKVIDPAWSKLEESSSWNLKMSDSEFY